MSEGGEKTEEPTQKKIDDARKEGNVWKSKDLSGVIAFAVALGVVKAGWSGVETRVKQLFLFSIASISHPADLPMATYHMMVLAFSSLLLLSLPVAFGAAIAGGLAEFLQVGSLFAVKAVMPKLEKLNPIAGAKNLFGKKQLVEMAKSIFKLSVTGYVVYGVVRDSMALVVATIRGDAQLTMMTMGELVFRVVVKVVLLFIAFSVFDVWWQHKKYMKDLMMSKDEVKKEYKESEGDPHHKAKRREFAMELLESAEMNSVKDSDVVVTNPDHVAVALHYKRGTEEAPRVVAKGHSGRAELIRELARRHDVPLLRNVPLAHALLRVDLNEQIPEELYDAVAEVLNFVDQLRNPPKA